MVYKNLLTSQHTWIRLYEVGPTWALSITPLRSSPSLMMTSDSHILHPLKGVPPAFQGLGGLFFQFYKNKENFKHNIK